MTAEHAGKEVTLCNIFQIQTHLFPRSLVFHLPSPSMKISLHGCIFSGQFSCRPRRVLPLVALVHFLLQDVIPFQNLLDCCVLWSCGCRREVKVPSINQVCVTETSLIYLEKISSISHLDHAVYNKLSGSWSTSSQQAFRVP